MWGDVVPEKRDTLPAEPTFCFLCKRFAKFCKEMWEALARPGELGWASDPSTPGEKCSTYRRGLSQAEGKFEDQEGLYRTLCCQSTVMKSSKRLEKLIKHVDPTLMLILFSWFHSSFLSSD